LFNVYIDIYLPSYISVRLAGNFHVLQTLLRVKLSILSVPLPLSLLLDNMNCRFLVPAHPD